MGINGLALKESIGIASCIFILLVLLSVACQGTETKTAYTRDGINFVSKERMEENIRYEYAKPGDYREVQVPLTTIVVNASVMPQIAANDATEEEPTEESGPSNSSQNAAASLPEKSGIPVRFYRYRTADCGRRDRVCCIGYSRTGRAVNGPKRKWDECDAFLSGTLSLFRPNHIFFHIWPDPWMQTFDCDEVHLPPEEIFNVK